MQGQRRGAAAHNAPDPWLRVAAYSEQLEAGHRYSGSVATSGAAAASGNSSLAMAPGSDGPAWTAKPGSHDDGTLCGLFLGGVGAPAVGRNLDGSFARWHLQNGYHLSQKIEQAFFALRWEVAGGGPAAGTAAPATDLRGPEAGTAAAAAATPSPGGGLRVATSGYLRLADPPPGGPQFSREVLSLFPVIHEHYHGQMLPLEAVAEFYSPLLPESTLRVTGNAGEIPAATLPVFVAEITVRNRAEYPLSVDTACFWPNLLGWKLQQSTTLDRAAQSWPGQTHAGNSARAVVDEAAAPGQVRVAGGTGAGDVAALQTRHTDRPVNEELMGEVAVYSPGAQGTPVTPGTSGTPGTPGRASVEACCKAQGNKIDRPPEQQAHTLAWIEDQFRLHGTLPETGLSWSAHWDEALCSAVSRGEEIPAGESRCFTFIVAFDLPLVRFGDGRHWYRTYTAAFGTDGQNALQIARYAGVHHQRWRAAVDDWHRAVLDAHPRQLAGAMLNELYFMNGGGSVWVERWAAELDPEIAPPRLGTGEHCALLEGYDIGYYYYNTSDLWPYAWYAVWRWWPSFARNVFSDLLRTVPLEIPDRQMIYRSETMEPLLIAGKIPHDIGAVMEDPWHRLNGYQMRDDCNLWKDHNPAFILSLYLERQLSGGAAEAGLASAELAAAGQFTERDWAALRQAGIFMLEQADPNTGLPLHQEFGDSTWDNLGIRGYASYSAGFTLGALAALARVAEQFDDHELAAEARRRLGPAQAAFTRYLWNGEYYRICDRGKYADCIMGDGVLGIFLAELAGLGDMLDAIPQESLRAHLRACYRYSFLQYRNGSVGPLLVAAPGKTRFLGDGGDELQVNEVLLGSAWACVAMMEYFGLEQEAQEIAAVLVKQTYAPERNGLGLQYRTPAAIDGEGRFRAPMNMRPLSIWLLEAVRRNKG